MTRFLLPALLLLCPCVVRAQTTLSTSFPRWHAGLQYGRQDYQLVSSKGLDPGRTNARRPQATIGYQFTPRLAVQVGFSPYHHKFTYGGTGTNQAGQLRTEVGSSDTKTFTVPVLARYTLAVEPLKNLNLDVMAGGVLLWSKSKTEFTSTENGVITSNYQSTDKIMNTFVAFGPSARYGFGRHIEVFTDWMFYKNLRSAPAYQPNTIGSKSGLTNSINLGVRYRFGY